VEQNPEVQRFGVATQQKAKDGRGRADGERPQSERMCSGDVPPLENVVTRFRVATSGGKASKGRLHGEEFCFVAEQNAVNPRIGSGLQYIRRLWKA